MSDSDPSPDADEWAEFAASVNETMLGALERNVEVQTEFVDAWVDSLEEGVEPAGDPEEALESYARAYEIWMDAATAQSEDLLEGLETGDVSATTARDRWLDAANEAFKEVMGTSAFAAATGQTVERALEAQRAADEAAEETLHALGFATRSDVQEVGERLVELERRQHAVEQNLERVLDALGE